ncbi:MAG: alpha/beta hydrolase [bacterium]
MKKVYIVHGYTGTPDGNWFPWLKSELEKIDDVTVKVLAMPNTDHPICSEWLPYIQSEVLNPDENTYFVGHSLGCITIVQYLNNLNPEIKTGGAVLVAGFVSPIHFTELNSFFDIPLDFEKIKRVANKIIAISSDNDPHVPYWQAEELETNLGAELYTIQGGQHLNKKAGYKEIPLVLEKVEELMGL